MSEPYLGEIKIFGGTFAPRGYASCNGAQISISVNTALYAILGTVYGGDGRTTFLLPNLQSRVAIGFGHGPGLSQYNQGQTGGTENTTLLVANLPPHTHQAVTTAPTLQSFGASVSINAVNRPSSRVAAPGGALITGGVDSATGATINGFAPNGSGAAVALDASSATLSNAAATFGAPTTTLAQTGSSLPFSSLQPYLAVNYIIAVQGVFPSRN